METITPVRPSPAARDRANRGSTGTIIPYPNMMHNVGRYTGKMRVERPTSPGVFSGFIAAGACERGIDHD
jgi:hypothetical protein